MQIPFIAKLSKLMNFNSKLIFTYGSGLENRRAPEPLRAEAPPITSPEGFSHLFCMSLRAHKIQLLTFDITRTSLPRTLTNRETDDFGGSLRSVKLLFRSQIDLRCFLDYSIVFLQTHSLIYFQLFTLNTLSST